MYNIWDCLRHNLELPHNCYIWIKVIQLQFTNCTTEIVERNCDLTGLWGAWWKSTQILLQIKTGVFVCDMWPCSVTDFNLCSQNPMLTHEVPLYDVKFCMCVCVCYGDILDYWFTIFLKPCIYNVTRNTHSDIISLGPSQVRLLSARRCDSSHCTKFHSLFIGCSWCKGFVAFLFVSMNICDFYSWWMLKRYSLQSWFHTKQSTIWKKSMWIIIFSMSSAELRHATNSAFLDVMYVCQAK